MSYVPPSPSLVGGSEPSAGMNIPPSGGSGIDGSGGTGMQHETSGARVPYVSPDAPIPVDHIQRAYHGDEDDSWTHAVVLYVTQLLALIKKNFLVLSRSPKSLLTFLLLPAIFIAIMWIIQARLNDSNDVDVGGIDVEVNYHPCSTLDIYGNPDPSQPCVSVYYSPNTDPEVENIMQAFSSRSGLKIGSDIIGVPSVYVLMQTLAQNVGRFDSAITFDLMVPPMCFNPPCVYDEVTKERVFPEGTSQADIEAHKLMQSIGQKTDRLQGEKKNQQWVTCPITQNMNVSYTLYMNTTMNYNDRIPSWLNNPPEYTYSTSGAAVGARYWILQHLINLAIVDVITAPGVPVADMDMKSQELYATEERRIERMQELSVQRLQQSSDPTASNSLHFSLFSILANGRTGTQASYQGDDFSLADYANDSVPKWAGGSIVCIAVLVLTLLSMQLVSHEKQSRIIGILRIMGMQEGNYWWSWLFTFGALACLSSIIAVGMGRISGLQVFHYCDFAIHFVALFLYLLSMACIAMLFTSFINRTLILNIVGFILFFAAVMCNSFFGGIMANFVYRPDMPGFLQIIFYVFPWFHYSKIWSDILLHTSVITFNDKKTQTTSYVQFRYTWADITTPQTIYEGCAYGDDACCAQSAYEGSLDCFTAPSTADAMQNMVILSAFYLVFAYYFASVFGGSLGQSRKFYFFLEPSFWGLRSAEDEKLDQLKAMHQEAEMGVMGGAAGGPEGASSDRAFLSQDRLMNEQYLSLKNQELRLYKLSKSYKQTSALKECTLKMHRDEVFVLLGHNGAGKSTLVNCLTGLLEPTFGNAYIFGQTIQNVHRIQKEMGVAMQDDLLFDDLSARETIFIFGAIRGIPWTNLSSTVEEKLHQFHMLDYADKPVRALSGGMKRRLSLSLATLGDPKIVFLDEPTTGMDPVNRNKIWATIKALKAGRIVVLTTHNMEEADHLGDTIALMSGGRIRAMGSSLFLKNRYGAGYQLQLQINTEYHALFQTIIKQLLPGCEIIHSAGNNKITADQVGERAQQQQQQPGGVHPVALPVPGAAPSVANVQHGNVTIGLKRKSLRALPAFFAWLESEEQRFRSSHAQGPGAEQGAEQAKMLREWSLSNSTLEEVFLRLCSAEKNINEKLAGGSAEDDEVEAQMMNPDRAQEEEEAKQGYEHKCMLCRSRPALEKVTLYSKAGLPVEFADLLCGQCSHSPEMERIVGGVAGPSAAALAANASGASLPLETSPEDDAPIELRAEGDVTNPLLNPLLQPPPIAAAVSTKSTVQKGINNDLNIASQEDRFHEAWDAMGHAPPTMLAQVRALYLKNLDVLRAEKWSSLCKLIVLGIMSFIVAWQTTTSSNLCPQGWVRASSNWISDYSTLPCDPLNVTVQFAQYANNPVIAQNGPPGYVQNQLLPNNPPEGYFDWYDCQWQEYWPNPSFCGWLPTFALTYGGQNSQFNAYLQDPLQTNSGTGALERSGEDVPIGNYTWLYAQSLASGYTDGYFEVMDQTGTVISGSSPAIPPRPTQVTSKKSTHENVDSKNLKTPIPTDEAIMQEKLRDGSGRRRSLSSAQKNRVRSSVQQVEVVALDASKRETLNDLMYANQLWVDSNATSLPTVCSQGRSSVSAAIVLYLSQYDTSSPDQFMSALFPALGLEFIQNKPRPVENGKPVNETSATDFVPQLSYKIFMYDKSSLPQYFYVVYPNSGTGGVQCNMIYTFMAASNDVTPVIHGMSNMYLLNRMQSLYTNRSDLGRSITFTSYVDGTTYPLPGTGTYASALGNNTCPNPKINAQFVPFPTVNYSFILSETSIMVALSMTVFLSLLLFPNSISHTIYEREQQLMHMMRISGMNDLAYWAASYLWDASVYALWFAFLLIFGYAYGSIMFRGTSIGVFIFLILCFIHYIICLSWMIASLFNKRRIVLVVAYLLVVVVSFLSLIFDQFLGTSWNVGYLYVPPIAWVKVVSTIIRYNPQTISNSNGAQLLTCVLIMIFEGSVMGVLAIYLNVARYRGLAFFLPYSWRCNQVTDDSSSADVEMDQHPHSLQASANSPAAARLQQSLLSGGDAAAKALTQETEDIDVALERKKVNQLVTQPPASYPALLLHNLRKIFPGKIQKTRNGKSVSSPVKVAVDKLCLSVEFGECFGLLGPNGAGKSTTLSILTGLLDPTSGNGFLCGYSLLDSMDNIFSILGICTQQDIVWDDLTVYSHLMFYARLKGVPSAWEKGLVQYIAELIELDGDPLRKPASALSGGMRRRLSLGISLIGNPRIWLLDEPSTGLSPETRREIWSIIEKRKRRSRGPNGKAIVITTHSMEEADTLCDRIGILADGNLQCLGSAAHLKHRYGEGFKLSLHLQHDFERAGVREIVRSEARAIHPSGSVSSSALPPSHPLSKHDMTLAGVDGDDQYVLLQSPLQAARAQQHCNMLRFITKMAPHAVLSSIEGKNIQFRLHPDKVAGGAVSPAGSSSSSASPSPPAIISPEESRARTNEVLSVFNHMERHRASLLPLYDIEEWGLTQSSLEEVFMTIVKRYEKDDEIVQQGLQDNKKRN